MTWLRWSFTGMAALVLSGCPGKVPDTAVFGVMDAVQSPDVGTLNDAAADVAQADAAQPADTAQPADVPTPEDVQDAQAPDLVTKDLVAAELPAADVPAGDAGCAKNGCPPASTLTSSLTSIGLVSTPSMPASRQRMRSSGKTFAVSA